MPASTPALSAPLTFAPRLKDYLWGGRELERLFGRELPDGVIAESWEVSGHPAGVSVVDRGPLAGRDLPGLVAEFGTRLVGRRGEAAAARGEFPLLVKLLDASHALSVQVHPDDDYAAANGLGEPGKTEMWYIVHAEPGARIIHGLTPATDRAALRHAVAEGRMQDCLNRVRVRPGDSILVPAGTVHGILSGVVLVEIQQCSDTTFRIHDWDRLAADGRPRELHAERALDAIHFGRTVPVPEAPTLAGSEDGVRREVIAHCDHFVVERLFLEAGARFTHELDRETFEIWGVLSGRATVEPADAPSLALDRARFALLPATMGTFDVRAATDAVALRSYLPARQCPARDSNPEPAD
ncbi:MAG: mannose-6-phosphate isomerase [Gemmatimonadetes bacterium]|nr:mannose-6-phosphate isomerase [Gemmatimonadota bacterium]